MKSHILHIMTISHHFNSDYMTISDVTIRNSPNSSVEMSRCTKLSKINLV